MTECEGEDMRAHILWMLLALLMLTGCMAEPAQSEAGETNAWSVIGEGEPQNQDVAVRAEIGAWCEKWAQTLVSWDSETRRELLAADGYRGNAETDGDLTWLMGHGELRVREYEIVPTAEVLLANPQRLDCHAEISYTLEDADLNIYYYTEILSFDPSEDGWYLSAWNRSQNPFAFPGFSQEGSGEYTLFPRYTAEELARIEREQLAVYGLPPGEAAVKMLHLDHGTLIPTMEESRVWYHWPHDGELILEMVQPEGYDFWVIDSAAYRNIFTELDAYGMVEAGLPEGCALQGERLPIEGWYLCDVARDGEYQCTLAVNQRNGEIKYYDNCELRAYRDAPIYDAVANGVDWNGTYESKDEPGAVTLRRTAADAFSYTFTGSAGAQYGRISGNQGLAENGAVLFVLESGGAALTVYDLQDGEIREGGASRLYPAEQRYPESE